MAVSQRPITAAALNEVAGEPARRTIPSYHLIADADQNIPAKRPDTTVGNPPFPRRLPFVMSAAGRLHRVRSRSGAAPAVSHGSHTDRGRLTVGDLVRSRRPDDRQGCQLRYIWRRVLEGGASSRPCVRCAGTSLGVTGAPFPMLTAASTPAMTHSAAQMTAAVWKPLANCAGCK
jgi:hypothetical protein